MRLDYNPEPNLLLLLKRRAGATAAAAADVGPPGEPDPDPDPAAAAAAAAAVDTAAPARRDREDSARSAPQEFALPSTCVARTVAEAGAPGKSYAEAKQGDHGDRGVGAARVGLMTPSQLHAALGSSNEVVAEVVGVLLIDVRAELLFQLEHVAGSVNLPSPNITAPGPLLLAHWFLKAVTTTEHEFRRLLHSKHVVLLDHSTDSLQAKHSKALALMAVLQDMQIPLKLSLLAGGFSAFSRLYPNDVTSIHAVNSPGFGPKSFKRKLRKHVGTHFFDRLVESRLLDTMASCPPSQILPYLYIGSNKDAANLAFLTEAKVTHILVVAEELQPHFPDASFEYLHIKVKDAITENIEVVFPTTCEFLDSIRKAPGACVLVHCQAGVSRSAAVTLAYLVYLNYTLTVAYELVREKRPTIGPNAGFIRQLSNFEHRILGVSSWPSVADRGPAPRGDIY